MKRRSIILSLATAFLSTLVTLLVADLLIRLLLPVPEKGYGVWAAYPGSAFEMVSRPDGVRASYRYNKYGFRGGDFDIRPRGVRVVAVGDSYTEGVGVEEEESWPAVLAGYLSADDDVEVLNLGDAGSAPDRHAEIVARVAVALRPSHLVVCWITSDLRRGPEVPPDLEVLTELPDPLLQDRPTWQRPFAFLFRGLTYLLERSRKWPIQEGPAWLPFTDEWALAEVPKVAEVEGVSLEEARRLVDSRLSGLDPAVVTAAREREFNPSLVKLALRRPWSYAVTTADMDVSPAVLSQSTRSWLEWYASTARRHDIEPWLLYYPQPALVVAGPWGLLDEAHFQRPEVLGDTSVRDLIERHCRELGIPFIDATAVLQGAAASGLYLRYDTHPTAAAHQLVAAEVARRMRPHLGIPAGEP